MYTLFDFDGNLPAYVNITEGKTGDNKGAYDIPLLKRCVIVADRFYNDFYLLNIWTILILLSELINPDYALDRLTISKNLTTVALGQFFTLTKS